LGQATRLSLAALLLACGAGGPRADARPTAADSVVSSPPMDSVHAVVLAIAVVRGDSASRRDSRPGERLTAVARADSAGFLVVVAPVCEAPAGAPPPGAAVGGKRVLGYGCGGGSVTVRVPSSGLAVIVSRGL
jgi:hypothetical protein